MFCQNGSAILVAILAERSFGGWGITFVSVVFTVLYFVVVEAMAKTIRRPSQRPGGPGRGAVRLVPRPSARPADARAHRPANVLLQAGA